MPNDQLSNEQFLYFDGNNDQKYRASYVDTEIVIEEFRSNQWVWYRVIHSMQIFSVVNLMKMMPEIAIDYERKVEKRKGDKDDI